MTSRAGQAGRATLRAGGQALRRLAQLALAVVVLSLLAFGALAWRLAQGPLELPWLADRLAHAAAERGERLRVERLTLSWSGFRGGPGEALLVRALAVQASGRAAAQVGDVRLSFAVAGLLAGKIVPRDVTLTGLRVNAPLPGGAQTGAGKIDVPDFLHTLVQPGGGTGSGLATRLAAIMHVHVHDAAVALDGRQFSLAVTLAPIELDLDRDPHGGIAGKLTLTAHAGDQSADLVATARLNGDGSATEVEFAVSPLNAAALSRLAPALAPAAALDAPTTLSGTATLGPDLLPRHWHVALAVGSGTIHAGIGSAPLVSASVTADGDARAMTAALQLVTDSSPDGPRTIFAGHVDASRAAGGVDARATLTLDHVSLADLPGEWPVGAGGPGTRPWITKNITAGAMLNGRLAVSLHAPPDLSDVALTAIDGSLDGRDLTVWWLRPVPPIEHVDARLTITDPDVIDIRVERGMLQGIQLSNGLVHLTGISAKHQLATIDSDLAGPLADLLRILGNSRLHLFEHASIKPNDPRGTFAGHLTVAHLPLEDKASIDDIAISTRAHLDGVHLGGVAAGRDVDNGTLNLTASNDGLSIGGRAQVAHIPTKLALDLDFRAGPPGQVTKHVRLAATVGSRELLALGLPAQDFLVGDSALVIDVTGRRGGETAVDATADLTDATLTASRIAFAKPAGVPAQAHAVVQLRGDKLVSVRSVTLRGRDLDVAGSARFVDGRPDRLELEHVRLGLTDVRGSVRLPQGQSGYVVRLSGPSLDLSAIVDGASQRGRNDRGRPVHAAAEADPAVDLDVALDRVLLGRDRTIEHLVATANYDGRVLHEAKLSGSVDGTPLQASVRPEAGGRRLDVATDDLGAVLHGADVWDSLRGGGLRVTGEWDDRLAGRPLVGQATLSRFRVLDAPLIGRILKAATLYGVIDLLRGPGLGFARLTAPFRFSQGVLELTDAGLFSPSLGATLNGRINLPMRGLDVRGTIIPAYFFNALPGRLPVIGRLLSPERGGGVFAATYRVHGTFDNPSIGVNPVAALMPGVLRRVFNLFARPPAMDPVVTRIDPRRAIPAE